MSGRQLVLRQSEHQYVSERLSTYIDHQLWGAKMSGRERARIEAHLQTCELCRQELRTLRWTRDLLRKAPAVPIPRSFIVREADVVPQRPVRRRALFSMQWATAVVALLFAIVLAGDIFTGGRPLGRTSRAPAAWVQVEQAVPHKVTVVVEQEVAVEQEVTVEQEIVIEGKRLEEKAEEEPELPAAPLAAEKIRVAPPESQPGEAGAMDGVTRAPTLLAEQTESTPTPLPTPAPVLPTATAVQPEIDVTPEGIPPQEGALARAPWRIAEIGLGVVLISMVIAIFWLRRQM
jgi:hypothetical protein